MERGGEMEAQFEWVIKVVHVIVSSNFGEGGVKCEVTWVNFFLRWEIAVTR